MCNPAQVQNRMGLTDLFFFFFFDQALILFLFMIFNKFSWKKEKKRKCYSCQKFKFGSPVHVTLPKQYPAREDRSHQMNPQK